MHKEVKDYIQKHKNIVKEMAFEYPRFFSFSTIEILHMIYNKVGEHNLHEITYLIILCFMGDDFTETETLRTTINKINESNILLCQEKRVFYIFYEKESIPNILNILSSENEYVINWFMNDFIDSKRRTYQKLEAISFISKMDLTKELYDKLFGILLNRTSDTVNENLLMFLKKGDIDLLNFVVDNYHKDSKVNHEMSYEVIPAILNVNNEKMLQLIIDAFHSERSLIEVIIDNDIYFAYHSDNCTIENLRAIL